MRGQHNWAQHNWAPGHQASPRHGDRCDCLRGAQTHLGTELQRTLWPPPPRVFWTDQRRPLLYEGIHAALVRILKFSFCHPPSILARVYNDTKTRCPRAPSARSWLDVAWVGRDAALLFAVAGGISGWPLWTRMYMSECPYMKSFDNETAHVSKNKRWSG